jgi:uncharacterized membrane-anchored protein
MPLFRSDSPGEDRVGCLVLLVALVLGLGFTVLGLPPAPAVEAFQSRYFDAVGFLNTVVVTAGILAAVMMPIWLLVRSMYREQRRSL